MRRVQRVPLNVVSDTSATSDAGDALAAVVSRDEIVNGARVDDTMPRLGDSWARRPELAPNRDLHIDDELAAAPVTDGDLELAKALDRIADSIERITARLDSFHAERAEHLDAIEFLLREMVINTVPPPPRSIVLGGVVDREEARGDEMRRDELRRAELRRDDEISIVPDNFPLEIDLAVEVRSRFHDRWISGFSIAEAVESTGRCRYRLTRRSDGIPLPILFEACDVRPVAASFERRYVHGAPQSTETRA